MMMKKWNKQHWILLSVFLVFSLLFNGVVFYFQAKSVAEVSHQVQVLSRRHLLSGDTATARELLQSLTPNYLSHFDFSDELDGCRSSFHAIPLYFDEMKRSLHSVVCVKPNSEAFIQFFIFGNVLLILAFGFSWYFNSRYQKQLLLTTQARIDNHLQMAQIAEQVFHDVRSPIAALRTLQGSSAQISEPLRVLLRNAITRIEEITDQIQLKRLDQDVAIDHASVESISLWSAVDRVVSEKNLLLRNRKGVSIEKEIEPSAYDLFALGNFGQLCRVLSNIVNNSLEAIEDTGRVSIRVFQKESQIVVIEVRDTGSGISESVREKLFERGCTSKASGSGLGLYHGLKTVKEWSGDISVASNECGTSVAVCLKKADPPDWFPTMLEVTPTWPVIIVDDDASIHDVWDYRFQNFGLELIHLFTLEKLDDYIDAYGTGGLFLIDYELVGENRSGLDLIKSHGLQTKSLLVTSRYSDRRILESCIDGNIRLLPKFLAGVLPISLASSGYILVDDDPLVRAVWTTSADLYSKKLITYPTQDSFLEGAPSLDRGNTLCIDRKLGSDDGLDLAKEAHKMGFTDIHLTTGLRNEKGSIPEPWIRSVIDKNPPWVNPSRIG